MGYKHNIDDILEIGYDVLRKNGYHNVGINQILKEAGIPKGSFYNFFQSKEDFAKKVVQDYGEKNTKWMQEFFEKSEVSPLDSLKSFYRLMIDGNEADSFSSGCFINNVSIEVGRINDILAEEANQQFNTWLNILASVVLKGQEKGEISTKFSALEIAEYLHAGFYGTFSRMKVTRNRVYMDTWFDMSFEFIST